MSNTLTVRLPEELLERLREKSRRTGLPMARLVRQSLETALPPNVNQVGRKFAGVIKGGARNVSSRKGFFAGMNAIADTGLLVALGTEADQYHEWGGANS
jgi:hypothetical protein